MYKKYLKRVMDIVLSLFALIVLMPVFLVLSLVGAVKMRGNPFFAQLRPGKIDPKTGEEKIFKLFKFKSMTDERDDSGELLTDDVRLTKYGRILRSTSLDELPELINILKGDMSIVGPRPLLVQYLPLYTPEQRRRHEVLPGLTGLAQISGRNSISWEEKFTEDLKYIDHITFLGDVKIIFLTALKVFKREGISQENNATMEFFTGAPEEKDVLKI